MNEYARMIHVTICSKMWWWLQTIDLVALGPGNPFSGRPEAVLRCCAPGTLFLRLRPQKFFSARFDTKMTFFGVCAPETLQKSLRPGNPVSAPRNNPNQIRINRLWTSRKSF